MTTLETLAPRVEVYSIDEAFVDMSGLSGLMSLTGFGYQIRTTVNTWTDIHVCVGIAPTKTLAKLANHAAKHYPATGGVVDLSDPARQRRLLKLLPVNEVWGVGMRLTEKLNQLNITTALDLADADAKQLRRRFSVVLEGTIRELNGESCLTLEDTPPTKQQIVCSRSFGERITDYTAMRQAVAGYLARAMEKLRKEQRTARTLQVFIRTSPFSDHEPYYGNTANGQLSAPTGDTRIMMVLAMRLLDSIWKDGYAYSKAGVMLGDFYEPGTYQPELLNQNESTHQNSDALMGVLDQINGAGLGNIWFAGQGSQQTWSMKREHLSPSYTSRWSELPLAR